MADFDITTTTKLAANLPTNMDCPKSTQMSLARSPPPTSGTKKWVYLTWTMIEYTGAPKTYVWLRKDGVAKSFPAYAPGANSTLIYPIFLGPR